jgi:hypothetical protein
MLIVQQVLEPCPQVLVTLQAKMKKANSGCFSVVLQKEEQILAWVWMGTKLIVLLVCLEPVLLLSVLLLLFQLLQPVVVQPLLARPGLSLDLDLQLALQQSLLSQTTVS